MNEQSPKGYIIVKVSTASGAIPIEGATVIVQGKDNENKDILISLLTDRSGLTEKIALPTVSRTLSEAPSPTNKPYTTYNLDVFKEGYYPQHYTGVPVFEDIVAVQNASIVPISAFDAKDPYYSKGQVFDEYENPDL
ncbi:MAG: hypothetical protein IJP20_04440 [Clostridia bacterium]|nr:hypothetical protein [Clostridia bacterium]